MPGNEESNKDNNQIRFASLPGQLFKPELSGITLIESFSLIERNRLPANYIYIFRMVIRLR